MTPEEVFLKLVHGIGDRELAALSELYAEQTDVRHPMNPYGDHPLLSREALRQHFGGTGAKATEVIRFQPENIRIHQTADPEVIVAEFDYVGTVLATGEPFTASNVIVLRVRDGQIVESRDYIDHVAMTRARGLTEQLIAALREPAGAPAAS
jgi:ketosteroid isomerase-like protein